MSRLFKFFSISLFCLCSVAHAQETLQQLGEWMSHYYEKPAPDQFTKWLNDASAAGAFEKPSARFPLMIFTTEILKMNPDKGAQWCKDLATISSTSKAYVGWSFYNSNIPAAEQCVQTQLGLSDSDVKKIMSATRYDPLAKEPSTPADLDMLWAVFSATGNETAVNKIIDVLARPSPEKGTEGSVKMLLMKGAAKWSLTSNIRQHTRVAGIVQKRRVTESDLLKKELDEAVSNASK
ncbi:hypothetical protein [Undibacterium sp. CY21W]|uniref:hypothetical protein n=1 Tax=Undibacterium sp. CY21W TaxID=2762293 RepID=UPI00164BF7F0|nr:hypothetical protein [Undibacterium sp. CY21W]MBC3928651.1 hypothetical protein [Undibacterium sp. CY21W]